MSCWYKKSTRNTEPNILHVYDYHLRHKETLELDTDSKFKFVGYNSPDENIITLGPKLFGTLN
jgi:hypothetical protein